MTIATAPQFRIYGVGITRRPFRQRFLEHRRKFLRGEYNILDLKSAQQGKRSLRWKGWGWTDEKRSRFKKERHEVEASASAQMSATAIFELPVPDKGRLLERTESAIVAFAHQCGNVLIDRGMFLARRSDDEEAVELRILNAGHILDLPNSVVV